jgi:hypothetical protein
MPETQIEMFWACGTCKHRNLGRDMKCLECGKPKGDEPYIMPSDIEAAPTVTDPDLLRKAKAGANWKCKYCSSEQRRLDGLCEQCGSNQQDSVDRRGQDSCEVLGHGPLSQAHRVDEAKKAKKKPLDLSYDPLARDECVCVPSPDPFAEVPHGTAPYREAGARPEYRDEDESLAPVSGVPAFRPNVFRDHPRFFLGSAAVAAVVGLLLFLFWPHKVDVEVASVDWQHTVQIEENQLRHHEGFDEDRPGGALNVHALGERHHHDNHVLDHYEKVSYTYQEACGETCVDIPKTCRTTTKNCTSNKNGFATCTGGDTVCSGGGRSCSTKHCTRTGYKDEPRYRDDPVYRMWYSWDNWEWHHVRNVSAGGASTKTDWPTEKELHLGDRERVEGRDTRYHVVYRDRDSKTYDSRPSSLPEFERLGTGYWTIKVDRAGIIHDILPRH